MTHMRLQKLLYYVQGWSLAIRGNPMFDSVIQAWRHGPVAQDAWAYFKGYEEREIPDEEGIEPDTLSQDDRAFIESIWESYKKYSVAGLRHKTHNERPWQEARGDLDEDARSNSPISEGTMRDFFRQQYQAHERQHGITLDMIRKAEHDRASHRVISLEEALAKLNDEF